jgi:hypothetical protein
MPNSDSRLKPGTTDSDVLMPEPDAAILVSGMFGKRPWILFFLRETRNGVWPRFGIFINPFWVGNPERVKPKIP